MDYGRFANPFGAAPARASNPMRASARRTPTVGQERDAIIRYGMAKLAFADAWAMKQEEKGRSFSQQDIYDVAPPPNQAAKKWAKKQADAIVAANGNSLFELYAVARGYGYTGSEERFGNDLAFTSLGHGVHWTDDIPFNPKAHDAILIPHTEFYY